MTSEPNSLWSAAHGAIADLEAAADDAIVPGDLRPWCEGLLPRLERTRGAWQAYAAEEREVLDQIFADDPTLSPRVATMREGADRIRRELDKLLAEVKELLAHDLGEPAASEEPTDRLEALRRDMLEWVVTTRAHHGEVGTWLHESANRDRGVVD